MPVGDIAGRGWTLSDLPTPVMVLRERALAHNLSVMAEYCRAWGVDIAPHGKTTMAPQLWDRQLEAGAWGITAATVDQARVMRASGVPRVLLANELVDPVSIAWVAEQLTDPAFDLICYVDSDRGVDHPGGASASASTRPPAVGVGRVGVRRRPDGLPDHPGSCARRRACVVLRRPAPGGRRRLRGDHLSRPVARVPGARPVVPGPPPRAHTNHDRCGELRRRPSGSSAPRAAARSSIWWSTGSVARGRGTPTSAWSFAPAAI